MLATLIYALLLRQADADSQFLLQNDRPPRNRSVTPELFKDLERASRLADIAYCVSPPAIGISKPFQCLSRCHDFPDFELVTAWNTGPLLSDSAGYLAVEHGSNGSAGQLVVAFRGTYSIANAVADLSTVPQEYAPYPGDDKDEPSQQLPVSNDLKRYDVQQDRCTNCTVHIGFNRAWQNTKDRIMPEILATVARYPSYQTSLIGHSLGGAVAMLAALELQSRGLDPTVTTFGEPRVGNSELADYLDKHFDLTEHNTKRNQRYRRVTHVDDPIPLLPLTEWGFAMHAGEIYITKAALSPDLGDLRHCFGDVDTECIAGQDMSIPAASGGALRRRDLLSSVRNEIIDIKTEPWGIPSRYKLWQLFFAHRDYFHRIGLCVPGGDPLGGGHDYDGITMKDE